MWMYSELYSCPLTVILGTFTYRGYKGWSVLPILNYRVSILRRGDAWRTVTNIREPQWYKRCLDICRSIADGIKSTGNIVMDLSLNASFYGGIGTYILLETGLRPLSLDIVNTMVFKFYLKPYTSGGSYVEGRLEDWLLLQTGLREGLMKPVLDACESLGSVKDDTCIINSDLGEVAITRGYINEDDWLHIVPDNSPFRHVLTLETRVNRS
ncbi:MAG: hypothetical protein ACP5N5_04945 [Desulfurococcus sp.]|uniref:hypothetical protein n=1 Tax=Desulfurococcus sp. TaxID=51678 RepID=UPI003D0CAD0C